MKRILALTLIMALAAAPVILAQGHPGWGPKDGHPGFGHGKSGQRGDGFGMDNLIGCKKELNLTDEQVDKIQAINFEHRNMMIDLRADLEKAQLAKRHEMRSDNPDKNKVLLATRQISDIKAKMAEMKVEHRFELRDVLTQEQLDKWKACRRECRPGARGDGKRKFREKAPGQGQRLRDGSGFGG